MLEEHTGIVIKNTRYGEADRILTVFTKDRGKIKVMAKGGMSRKRHMAAQMQTFSVSSFVLYPGKNFYSVKSADFIKTFSGIQNDVERLAYASYLCELVDNFYEDRLEEEITFHLILYYLDFIQSQSLDNLPFIILSFMIKLLGINGILPDFSGCNNCGRTDADIYYLNFDTSEFLCTDCTERKPDSRVISSRQLSMINAFAAINLRVIPETDIKMTDLTECTDLVVMFDNYISYSLMKQTKSFRFLRDMIKL